MFHLVWSDAYMVEISFGVPNRMASETRELGLSRQLVKTCWKERFAARRIISNIRMHLGLLKDWSLRTFS